MTEKKKAKNDSGDRYRHRRDDKTGARGRDARTGEFTTVEAARDRPKPHTVERIPLPGRGDTVALGKKVPPHHGTGGVVRFQGKDVVLSRGTYERLVNRLVALEDIADARDLAVAIKNAKPEDYMPAALAERIFEGEHPLRVWREHRGLSARTLADKAEVPVSYVSEIETGKKPGSVDAYRALAEALDLTIDDLVP